MFILDWSDEYIFILQDKLFTIEPALVSTCMSFLIDWQKIPPNLALFVNVFVYTLQKASTPTPSPSLHACQYWQYGLPEMYLYRKFSIYIITNVK